ncbi:unnamed protein product [Discula destructiva]
MAEQEEEEPALPAYPSGFHQDLWDRQNLLPNKRKRSYAAQMFSDSSEPATFSSDNDSAAENYVQGPRQKKQYRGTWDQQQPFDADTAGSPASALRDGTRRKLEPVDSGVFMGSDSMDEGPEPPPPAASRLAHFTAATPHIRGESSSPRNPEAEALRLIERCVDQGNETVDLSSMDLEDISNEAIAKLNDVVPIPRVWKGVSFTQPEPQLKLFLSNNRLTRCPGQIFSLTNLTVLSLRGNGLTEIPPAVFQLTNLTQLNVSFNALKYLPMDLLELLYHPDNKLTTLNLHPNPFHKPIMPSPESDTSDQPIDDPVNLRVADLSQNIDDWPRWAQRGRRWLANPSLRTGIHACLVTRTPVQFRGGNATDTLRWGSTSKFHISSAAQQDLETEDLGAEPTFPSRSQPTRVLSLTELCLQTIPLKYPANTDWAEHVAALESFRDNRASAEASHLIKMLEDMDAKWEAGISLCTVCRRKVIRPAAQWIEWYQLYSASHADIAAPTSAGNNDAGTAAMPMTMSPLSRNPDERLVPFLRQACTWACVGDRERGLRC